MNKYNLEKGDKLIVKSSQLSNVAIGEIGIVAHIDLDGDLRVDFTKVTFWFSGETLKLFGNSKKCELDIFQLNEEPENLLIKII